MGVLRDTLWGVARDKRGAVSVLLHAAIIPLVAFGGLAVDTARGYLMKSRLNYALDAAALAGGKVMFDTAKRDAAIQKFFKANFPDGYMGATVTGPTLSVNTANQTIKLDATADMGTSLMRVVGLDSMAVGASSEVQRQIKGMELSLVLDNTGSMRHQAPGSSQSKVEDLKDAALMLTDILYAGRDEIDDFYVAVVPYTAVTNIGTQHIGWLEPWVPYNPSNFYQHYPAGQQFGYLDPSVDWSPWKNTSWKGCVEARWDDKDGNPAVDLKRDRNDDPPGTQLFYPSYWPKTFTSNDWPPVVGGNESGARGPNKNCPDPIQPLVKSKTTVDGILNGMEYWRGGGTLGNNGLVWGWRVISPNWRGQWSGGDDSTTLPKDYIADLIANNDELSDKAVVVMTDGRNNIVSNHYSAYGMRQWAWLGVTSGGDIEDEINDRMLETCTMMKDKGVIIYTITFDTEGSSSAAVRQTYEDCATSVDHYFNSPGEDELTAAFIAIGTQLSNLRLAK
ncbi:MAG: pilus assembly protein TadG-related protein [Alphaproteobacteria bacterium]|nr:pilus assembly protein TadG-related protein [Alphaproteobacteria bacterium]